jgi:FkbM family methyltransferase
MEKIISWLIEKPTGGVLIPLDISALFLLKVFYLTVRISFGIILGKNKRNRLPFFKRFYISNSFSLSFYLHMYTYRFLDLLSIRTPLTTKIYVPKYNYMAYCPLNKDDFTNMTTREDDILSLFYPKDGDTVVDIGAHIGRYTMISSKRVCERGKVVSIEADPLVFEILNQNIKLNQITNVISLNCAVYSKQTKIRLFLPGEEENHTIYNTIMSDRATDEKKFVEVNANTLDAILQSRGISEVNWIKIDVEGAELEVLKGSTNVLSKSKDVSILIEIHNLDNNKNLYEPIMELLGSYNFRIEFERTHEGGEKHVIVRKNS